MKKIIISKDINHTKINSDISILSALQKVCKSQNWRMVVSGGYGLDGYLRIITRSHGDLDVIIYGQNSRVVAQELIIPFINARIQESKIVVKVEQFYLELDVHGKGFVGNIYYVETVNDPNLDLSQVRKHDGSTVANSNQDFPPPIPGKLGDLDVEVQDQGAHLSDILRKRISDTSHAKHDQDIANIKLRMNL